MLLLGVMTKVMMGFSPTIWASALRTDIFFWFSVIAEILYLYSRYSPEMFEPFFQKHKTIATAIEILVIFAIVYTFTDNYVFIDTL
jgi:hypothetical protein